MKHCYHTGGLVGKFLLFPSGDTEAVVPPQPHFKEDQGWVIRSRLCPVSEKQRNSFLGCSEKHRNLLPPQPALPAGRSCFRREDRRVQIILCHSESETVTERIDLCEGSKGLLHLGRTEV